MTSRFYKKWKSALCAMLKNGMGGKQISLCVALGIVLGIFPVLGLPTILCAMAAFTFRLNMPAIQLVNYMAYPLQLALLAPFYSAGNWLFGRNSNLDEFQNLILKLKSDFWGSMTGLWDLMLYAIITWSLICPFLILILYLLIKPVIYSFAPLTKRNRTGKTEEYSASKMI